MEKSMPQEIDVWYILPAIRRELAIALKKSGMKQQDIASKLGITNSAISQYIQNKRAGKIKFDKKITDIVKNSAKKIAHGSNVVKEIFEIEKAVKKSKVLCSMCINEKGGCNICCK